MNNLFIPTKIRVGYQKRKGTYTGKLAYVIYYDAKGVLRKEKSWKSWCHFPDSPGRLYENGEYRNVSIEPSDFDNVPTEGFVLNKGVGGVKQSYNWNARNEYIRVYDPRDFEFEISVENLLYILSVTSCTPGKGLEGKFVYSWDGTSLVLLPVNSPDFQSFKEFTSLQGKKFSAKELVPGNSYKTKSNDEYVYIGRYMYYPHDSYRKQDKKVTKKQIFYSLSNKKYLPLSVSSVAECSNNECYPTFAELACEYQDSKYNNLIVGLKTKPNSEGIFKLVDNEIVYNHHGYYFYKLVLENGYLRNTILDKYNFSSRGIFKFGAGLEEAKRVAEVINNTPSYDVYLILSNGKEVKRDS